MSVPCAAEILTVDDGGEAEPELEPEPAADGGSDEGWEVGSGEVVFSAGKMKTIEKKKSKSPWGEEIQVYKVQTHTRKHRLSLNPEL